jgi:hypothetical protein
MSDSYGKERLAVTRASPPSGALRKDICVDILASLSRDNTLLATLQHGQITSIRASAALKAGNHRDLFFTGAHCRDGSDIDINLSQPR